MKEQELDRLREQIFRFQAAQEREQTAKQQYMQAQKQEERRKAELEEVRECAQEQKHSDRKWMLTGVTGLIVMLTGIVLMVCCFSDNIFMTALLGILILLGLASTITSFLQLSRNQRSCHLAKASESNGLCHGAASRRRDAGAVLAAGTGAEQGVSESTSEL